MALGIHVDGVDVIDHAGAARDVVAHVGVVLGNGVGDAAEGRGRHPAEGFFDAAAEVLQVGVVVHGWEAVRADDAVELGLGFLLDVREENHGLDEGVEGAGSGVGAGFEEAARHVGCLVVAEALLFLLLGDVDAETGLCGAVFDAGFCFEPVVEIELLLDFVQGFGLRLSW